MTARDPGCAPDPNAEDPWSVAIVGLGPDGLSVLERLIINLSRRPATRPVEVWVIDPVEHGPGRVWRTNQPWWLTMNATAGEVTVRSPDNYLFDTSVAAPDFSRWTVDDGGPAVASPDFPERRHYGRYLGKVFAELCAHCPPGVRVHPVLGNVTAIQRADHTQWLVIDHGRLRLRADKVVLATGHADLSLSEADRLLREHAESYPGVSYLGHGLTTDLPLDDIPAGAPMGVRGLGLSFYDVLRSLTLGRGGRFCRSVDGTLAYLASGREPVVIAGSRGGLPFLSRPRVAQPPQTAPSPLALTTERIEALRGRARSFRGSPQPDFAAEVEPLIQLELDHAYYHCIVRLRSGRQAAKRFSASYRTLMDDDQPRTEPLLVASGLTGLPRPDVRSLARPFDSARFAGPEQFRDDLTALLRQDVLASRQGTRANPLKAALESLRSLRPALPAVADFGGLLPKLAPGLPEPVGPPQLRPVRRPAGVPRRTGGGAAGRGRPEHRRPGGVLSRGPREPVFPGGVTSGARIGPTCGDSAGRPGADHRPAPRHLPADASVARAGSGA
jgi:hypothetical protein